jgi:site-specific DNA-methyltransferase (adenine-specific)
MGSGSTGVACMNTGRKFIGIEKEVKYFDIAAERLLLAEPQAPSENSVIDAAR